MFAITTAINFAEVGKHCQGWQLCHKGTWAKGGVISKDGKLSQGLQLHQRG
jgi:hypothetical protein